MLLKKIPKQVFGQYMHSCNIRKNEQWDCQLNFGGNQKPPHSPGGVLPMWWVIHMCRGFDPLFSLWQDRARSFWGVFSHPPTQKRSFGYKSSQNSIFLAPKYHFSLDLFGSNFQWPAAHPQQFSDRVPPPGPTETQSGTNSWYWSSVVKRTIFLHYRSQEIFGYHMIKQTFTTPKIPNFFA